MEDGHQAQPAIASGWPKFVSSRSRGIGVPEPVPVEYPLSRARSLSRARALSLLQLQRRAEQLAQPALALHAEPRDKVQRPVAGDPRVHHQLRLSVVDSL